MDTRRGKRQHLWSRLPRRFRCGMLVAIATSLIGWSAAWSEMPPPSEPAMPKIPATVDPSSQPGMDRLREGTELQDARGYFRFVDDRVIFFRTGSDARYIGLENLNLERIVSEITNNPTQVEWTVVGTITEYRGANYLMVRRAILPKSAAGFVAPQTSEPAKTEPPVAESPKPLPSTPGSDPPFQCAFADIPAHDPAHRAGNLLQGKSPLSPLRCQAVPRRFGDILTPNLVVISYGGSSLHLANSVFSEKSWQNARGSMRVDAQNRSCWRSKEPERQVLARTSGVQSSGFANDSSRTWSSASLSH